MDTHAISPSEEPLEDVVDEAADGAAVGAFARRLIVLMAGDWPLLFVLFATVAVQVAYLVSIPFIFMHVLDHGLPERDVDAVMGGVALLAALVVAQGLGAFVNDRVAGRLSARLLGRLRWAMYEKIGSLSDGFLRATSTSRIMTIFSRDTLSVEVALSRTLPRILVDAVFIVCGVLSAFAINWILALIAVAVVALATVLPAPLAARAMTLGLAYRGEEAKLAEFVGEALTLSRVVRAFQLHRVRRNTFRVLAQTVEDLGLRSNRLAAHTITASFMTFGVLIVFVLGVGSWLVLEGRMEAGAIVAFLILLATIQERVEALSAATPVVIAAANGLHRIDGLLGEKSVTPPLTPSAASEPITSIEFQNVTFAYPGSERATLKNLSFRIDARRSVAFVGKSGSGKSTILHLLLGNAVPTSGRILINDTDLTTVKDDRFARATGLVAQENGLFDLSIAQNIALGGTGAEEADIVAAARAANIHDDILAMPSGYDTVVGEGGGRLSGGQRQRIAIARALVRTPDLLILDEVTAALDPSTERYVNAVIASLHHNATVLAVTHRLNQIVHFDTVYVLSAGRIVESGPHDELVSRGGTYATLWANQNGLEVSESGLMATITPERLHDVPLFAGVPPARLASVAGRTASRLLEPGQTIFAEGAIDHNFYIVVRGEVRLTAADGGREIDLERVEAGGHFGEVGLLDEAMAQHAHARAVGHCFVLVLPREEVLTVLGDEPSIRDRIMESVDHRIDAKVEVIMKRRHALRMAARKSSTEAVG